MASESSRRIPRLYVGAIGFGVGLFVALVAAVGWYLMRPSEALDLGATYQAVLLSNGNAYFGRIADRGGHYIALDDVYYIQRTVNRETNEATTRLIKRGSEPHGPTRMLINTEHVLFIESVGPDSAVGRMIADAQKAK